MATDKKPDVFEDLLIKDNKLLKEFDDAKKDHRKILDIYARRVNLYKQSSDQQRDRIIKAIIDVKKTVIMSDMGLLSAQYDIQSDINKIKSRLDALEGKISHILNQKSP